MIFLKKSIITITILVVAIWVMPATSNKDETIDQCKVILIHYCDFQNNKYDFEGTIGEKFNLIQTTAEVPLQASTSTAAENVQSRSYAAYLNHISTSSDPRVVEYLQKLNKTPTSRDPKVVENWQKRQNDEMLVLLKNFATEFCSWMSLTKNQELLNLISSMEQPVASFCTSLINESNYNEFIKLLFARKQNPEKLNYPSFLSCSITDLEKYINYP